MFYGDVFKALNKDRVRYVVAGGTAVVLHGYPRLTQDLDLVVHLEAKNLNRFYEALVKIGYRPRVPVTRDQFIDGRQRKRWQKDKGMIVFSFVHKDPPFKVIDMFVEEPIRFDYIYKRKIMARAGNMLVPLMCIDHLKKLKQKAGRPQDLIDIVQLNAINRMRKRG